MSTIFNLISFYAGWFAAVIGAATNLPLLGPLVISALVTVHVSHFCKSFWRTELRFIVICTALGSVVDSICPLLKLVSFPPGPQLPWGYPLWLMFLWASFATTFSTSFRWMSGRYFVAFFFGLIGGPLSYVAAVGFNAVVIEGPQALVLTIYAIEWGILLPILLKIHRTLFSSQSLPPLLR